MYRKDKIKVLYYPYSYFKLINNLFKTEYMLFGI